MFDSDTPAIARDALELVAQSQTGLHTVNDWIDAIESEGKALAVFADAFRAELYDYALARIDYYTLCETTDDDLDRLDDDDAFCAIVTLTGVLTEHTVA